MANFSKNAGMMEGQISTKERGKLRSNQLVFFLNLELGVKTKFVTGLPRANQIGLEHEEKIT